MAVDADKAVRAFLRGVPASTFHNENQARLVEVALGDFARWLAGAGEELKPPTSGEVARLAGWRLAQPPRPRSGGVAPAGEVRK